MEAVLAVAKLETQVERLTKELSAYKNAAEFSDNPVMVPPNGKHFHRDGCEWTQAAEDVQYMRHEEAVSKGFKPCKTCCA